MKVKDNYKIIYNTKFIISLNTYTYYLIFLKDTFKCVFTLDTHIELNGFFNNTPLSYMPNTSINVNQQIITIKCFPYVRKPIC